MNVLMIVRLMSGFMDSIKTGEWNPTGAPAIYRIINRLDQAKGLDIIFTLKENCSLPSALKAKLVQKRRITMNGLSAQPKLLFGPSIFPKWLGALRYYFSEFRQCWNVYRYVKKVKPDIVYIDRSNILLGAVVARFTKTPVYLRLLGTPPSLEILLKKPALSHYLYRWAYRSPFQMVLCSRDGSPGKQWMQNALDPKTPRKSWLNGVDLISRSSRQPSAYSESSVIRVILMGRLNPLKRIDQAVDAILNLPKNYLEKLRIDIIGEGELFSLIKEKTKNKKQFILHGAIPHQKVLEYLSQGDIFISLNTHGNLTNTVLEAIRCGLCLILPEPDHKAGIDVDTLTVISKDSAILLSKVDYLNDLTSQLQKLIDQPALIRSFQEKTQGVSKKIHTWDQRIERELTLLKPYDMVVVISDLQGGGTQKVLERLLKQWVLKKKRIAIVTLDSPDNDTIQLPDVVDRISLNSVRTSKHFLMAMLANFARLWRIRRIIKRLNTPLVLSFLNTINILTVLATRGLSCRLIISERNDPARQNLGRIWDMLRKQCYRYADVVTANSYFAIQTMMQFVDPEKCRYVPNPVELPDLIQPIELKKPTILAVGRLHRQKAYDVLIHAFYLFLKKNPDWQLLILGEGPLRTTLEKQINDLQLQDVVQLKGYVNPFPYLASAEIYTMPSRYEGMPNALLEAMAMSMPVVISDALMGPLDFITDRRNALVVPTDNVDALADTFDELASNPELRKTLAKNAQQSIAPFSMDVVLPQWEGLFHA